MRRNFTSWVIGLSGLLLIIIVFAVIIESFSNNNYLIINNVDTSVTYTVGYEVTCVPSNLGDYKAQVTYIDKTGHTITHGYDLPFSKQDKMYLRDPILLSATLNDSLTKPSNSCNFTCNIFIDGSLWRTSSSNSLEFPQVECGGILDMP